MAESSFDVVSKVDEQEVDNALNQTAKEIGQRFDFKNTGASIRWTGKDAVEITASSPERVNAVLEVFKERLVKRQVSLKSLDHSEPVDAAGGTARLAVAIRQGIDEAKAREIVKAIKAAGAKTVHAQVQGDTVRVSSKKRDDLQGVIAALKADDFGVPLQFTNYR